MKFNARSDYVNFVRAVDIREGLACFEGIATIYLDIGYGNFWLHLNDAPEDKFQVTIDKGLICKIRFHCNHKVNLRDIENLFVKIDEWFLFHDEQHEMQLKLKEDDIFIIIASEQEFSQLKESFTFEYISFYWQENVQ